MRLVLMMLSGVRAGERVVVERLPFRIGRGEENDLPLDEVDHVSTAHGELRHAADGTFQYVDLGSTNGSAVRRAGATGFLDLRGYRRRADNLQPGDELHLGDPTAPFRIAVVFEQDVPDVPSTDLSSEQGSAVDTLGSAFDAPDPSMETMRAPTESSRATAEEIDRGHLPPLLTQGDELVPLEQALRAVKLAQTREALVRGEGDRSVAAELLGIDMDRMLDLLMELGLS